MTDVLLVSVQAALPAFLFSSILALNPVGENDGVSQQVSQRIIPCRPPLWAPAAWTADEAGITEHALCLHLPACGESDLDLLTA